MRREVPHGVDSKHPLKHRAAGGRFPDGTSDRVPSGRGRAGANELLLPRCGTGDIAEFAVDQGGPEG